MLDFYRVNQVLPPSLATRFDPSDVWLVSIRSAQNFYKLMDSCGSAERSRSGKSEDEMITSNF